MRRYRDTKIVATLGPSSTSYDEIKAIFQAGADVFRLNFSHGTHADHQQRLDTVRKIEHELNHPISVIADLQGPKLRIGTFESGKITLHKGETFKLFLDKTPGTVDGVSLPHPEIFAAITPHTELLLDDGKIRLEVISHTHNCIVTKVNIGGELSNRKGVNIPSVMLPIDALTPKDLEDLDFALKMGVDWIALSFVQRPEDVKKAKDIIDGQAGVISKLEKPMAMQHLSEIIKYSDALMVARGDLGVEMLPEQVPGCQREIIRLSRASGKPVIVATQMLDSMVNNPAPTRAEASDVATAVYQGADAVMLSAESASGNYATESVTMMDRIIKATETDKFYKENQSRLRPPAGKEISDAITAAAREIAETIKVGVIVTFTESGFTAFCAAKERPTSPILALTPSEKTARKLPLLWGAHPIKTDEIFSVTQMVDAACDIAIDQDYAKPGEHIIVIAGVPFGQAGTTNIIRVAQIPHE